MSCLSEELKLPLQIDLGSLVIVDSLDALDGLVVILLNQVLRPNFANIVQTRVADAADVFLEVLSQAVH